MPILTVLGLNGVTERADYVLFIFWRLPLSSRSHVRQVVLKQKVTKFHRFTKLAAEVAADSCLCWLMSKTNLHKVINVRELCVGKNKLYVLFVVNRRNSHCVFSSKNLFCSIHL